MTIGILSVLINATLIYFVAVLVELLETDCCIGLEKLNAFNVMMDTSISVLQSILITVTHLVSLRNSVLWLKLKRKSVYYLCTLTDKYDPIMMK